MARPNIKRRHTDLQLESVSRISNLPIVESGIYIAGNVYEKIKRSNSLMGWGLDTAEHSLAMATASAIPAMIAFTVPIMTLDHLLCKGIDIVEQRVPAVTLPPHLMYWNTREFVNNKFVKPVLIRADSVKLIGSQAANAAVERLVGAINVADQYVDRYLPADPADKIAETVTDSAKSEEQTHSKAQRTIEHGARFSRKLQRRLTRRTLAEARALKEQGTECIHVLLYVVELLATDPKLAMQKAKELWASLSLPEPENQARPTNLEQLLVLFTRETARRIVHLVNGTTNLAARTPRRLARALLRISHQLVSISEQALKVTIVPIFRLLAHVLEITSFGHHRQLLETIRSETRLANLHDRTNRKIVFQTNGGCGSHGFGSPGTGNGGSSNASGGGCLSLIAKINILPLPRPVSTNVSSLIEELRPGDEGDQNGQVMVTENVSQDGEASENKIVDTVNHKIPLVAKKTQMLVANKTKKLPVKNSPAYNGELILPTKANKCADKKMPFLAGIKPMPPIRQKQ